MSQVAIRIRMARLSMDIRIRGHLINGRDRKRRISSEAKALFVGGGYVGAKALIP
jgi:hypothetical protein